MRKYFEMVYVFLKAKQEISICIIIFDTGFRTPDSCNPSFIWIKFFQTPFGFRL